MKSDHELIKEAKALCQKFVNKVESGRARSVETYADCKAFLENFKSAAIDSCHICGEKCNEVGNCVNENCNLFGEFAIF